MPRPRVLAYGPPLLVEGATAILKNLDWFETVQMIDPVYTSLDDLRQEENQLLIFFSEGLAPREIERFSRYVVVSDQSQSDGVLVALSTFDTLKTFRVGLLSALSGLQYRSQKHKNKNRY